MSLSAPRRSGAAKMRADGAVGLMAAQHVAEVLGSVDVSPATGWQMQAGAMAARGQLAEGGADEASPPRVDDCRRLAGRVGVCFAITNRMRHLR